MNIEDTNQIYFTYIYLMLYFTTHMTRNILPIILRSIPIHHEKGCAPFLRLRGKRFNEEQSACGGKEEEAVRDLVDLNYSIS